MKHEWVVHVPPEHPSLPGHFPGHPVVPGVVILEEVIAKVGQLDPDLQVMGLPAVKLSSPLKPGEALMISVTRVVPGELEFRCLVESRPIASGTMQVRSRTAGQPGWR